MKKNGAIKRNRKKQMATKKRATKKRTMKTKLKRATERRAHNSVKRKQPGSVGASGREKKAKWRRNPVDLKPVGIQKEYWGPPKGSKHALTFVYNLAR